MPSSRSSADRIIQLGDDASLGAAVERAARVIVSGGLLVYPTETVYGIGADARNADAVSRIPVVKGRDEKKPILVLVGSSAAAREFAANVPDTAELLMQAFWPGPLALVFRARQDVPETLTAGTGTIGLRCSPNAFCRALVQRSGKAITSTSANRAGERTPPTIAEISRQLGEGIDLYVDEGPLGGALPSTIVDVSGPTPRVIREGAIPRSRLHQFIRPD